MTWGEFKAMVEAQGITDDTVVNWIDVARTDFVDILRDDEDGSVSIC